VFREFFLLRVGTNHSQNRLFFYDPFGFVSFSTLG